MWSPASSADDTITPIIFVRKALPHLGCLFWGRMIGIAPRKLKENGLKMCQLWRDQDLWVFSSLFPQKVQKCWRTRPRKRNCSFITYRESPRLQPQTHTPTSPPSLAVLSARWCLTHTPMPRKEKRKTTTMNHSEPTDHSIHLGKDQTETAGIPVFKQECRREGEDQVRVKVQKMGRKSWRRKGFAPCGRSK